MTHQGSTPENQTRAHSDSASDAARKSENPKGNAWQINDAAPDDSTDDDSNQSRTGGDYDGEAWRINEDTKD